MTSVVITAASALPIDLLEAKKNRRITLTDQDSELLAEIQAAVEQVETITRRQTMVTKRKLLLDRFPNEFGFFGFYPVSHGTLLPSEIYRNAIRVPNPPLLDILSITYVDTMGATQTMNVATDVIIDMTSEPARIIPAYGTMWPQTQHITNAVEIEYLCGHAVKLTADATADTITPVGIAQTFALNDIIRFSNSGGALPAGLTPDTDYYVLAPTLNVFQVSLTMGGSAVDITDTGTGTSYIGEVPRAIKRWIVLRAGTKFENREEVAVLNRGAIQQFGYVDTLLDPWRVITL